jgi:hypothetical protein
MTKAEPRDDISTPLEKAELWKVHCLLPIKCFGKSFTYQPFVLAKTWIKAIEKAQRLCGKAVDVSHPDFKNA